MIERIDKEILFFFNRTIKNDFWDAVFSLMSRLGDYQFVIACGVVLFCIGLAIKKKRPRLLGALIFIGGLMALVVVFLLKHFINRPRPFWQYPELITIGHGQYSSFPSSHSCFAALAAVILSYFYKRFSPFFWAAAMLIGTSRIYMGLHYFTDVTAGFLWGSLIGLLTLLMVPIFEKRFK